jgi:hypothetical protein
MPLKKFSQLPDAPGFGAGDILIGIRDNGDGTYKNYKYSAAEVIAHVLAVTRKVITAEADSDSLVDGWLADKVVMMLITDRQTYIAGQDFTQDGDTITGITITFYTDQKIIAFI